MTTTAPAPKQKTVFVEATIKLREAVSEDFREMHHDSSSGVMVSAYRPKYGQPYWLKSIKTNKFDNKNYQISEDTNWPEFKKYLRLKMVYVPASYFEIIDAEL